MQDNEVRRRSVMKAGTIDKLGRVRIPKRMRDRLELKPGSSVAFEEGDGRITLKPARRGPRLIREDGALVIVSDAEVDVSDAVEKAREARQAELRRGVNPERRCSTRRASCFPNSDSV
jgi:AbrB family looped-hinge helix DNA binding protein